jgi:hypothetical protein
MSDHSRDCKHGQLARSCEICELERERDGLRAENERLKALLRDWCSVPWQHKTPEMLERTIAALERPE